MTENNERYFISITYNEGGKSYCFGTEDNTLEVGDHVLVESSQGVAVAKVVAPPQSIDKYSSSLELKDIIRRANEHELRQHEDNIKDAALAMAFCQTQVERLDLKMTLLASEYTFDRTKIHITYAAEERVDFRELVKILGSHLKTRVELRQIGSRDRAKLVGGLGQCGFPLCCHTFLQEFDGISINRAKNQMLPLNIPKLSGHCGKLLCCLKYEDDYYTESKKDFPNIGSTFTRSDTLYQLTSFNVVNRTVRLDYEGGFVILPLDELKRDYKVKYEKK
jgi:cell fate regulator YaaT (PSP1 superfamily)